MLLWMLLLVYGQSISIPENYMLSICLSLSHAVYFLLWLNVNIVNKIRLHRKYERWYFPAMCANPLRWCLCINILYIFAPNINSASFNKNFWISVNNPLTVILKLSQLSSASETNTRDFDVNPVLTSSFCSRVLQVKFKDPRICKYEQQPLLRAFN